MRRLFCRVTLTNVLILLLILTLLFNLSILLQILSTIEMRNQEHQSKSESRRMVLKNSRNDGESKQNKLLTNIQFLQRRGWFHFD